MAYIEFTDWSAAGRPRWAADYRSRDHLVPGGVKLSPTAFGSADPDTGKTFVPSGTPIKRANDTAQFTPAAAGDANAEVFLLAFDVEDVRDNNDGVLYRPGSVVKLNLLPGRSGFHADVVSALRRRYVCQEGVR